MRRRECPGCRISASPRPSRPEAVAVHGGLLPGHSGGTAPDSHRLPQRRRWGPQQWTTGLPLHRHPSWQGRVRSGDVSPGAIRPERRLGAVKAAGRHDGFAGRQEKRVARVVSRRSAGREERGLGQRSTGRDEASVGGQRRGRVAVLHQSGVSCSPCSLCLASGARRWSAGPGSLLRARRRDRLRCPTAGTSSEATWGSALHCASDSARPSWRRRACSCCRHESRLTSAQ